MEHSREKLKNTLKGLKDDPMRIIYTENFVEQTDRRDIPEDLVDELLTNEKPTKINEIKGEHGRFEVIYSSSDFGDLTVVLILFNLTEVILITAFSTSDASDCFDTMMDFKCIYDSTLDLLDLHSRYGFRHCRTVMVESGFNIDFDYCGYPVAVEMMMASKRFKIRSDNLSSSKFFSQIEVENESIRIKITAYPNYGQSKTIEWEIPNTFGISTGRFEFEGRDELRQMID